MFGHGKPRRSDARVWPVQTFKPFNCCAIQVVTDNFNLEGYLHVLRIVKTSKRSLEATDESPPGAEEAGRKDSHSEVHCAGLADQ